jgi:hypothetical protein
VVESTADELRRFDKNRKNKKVSNEEWKSPTDPDSRITKMKDGTTHLAYKAEHVIDLDTEIILAAEIYHADEHDAATLEDSVRQAGMNQAAAGGEPEIREVVADKGYHATETITNLDQHTNCRAYIAEPARPHARVWIDKPPEQERAVRNNRRRATGERGRRLQRLRSERVERSFAHVCETGGARRTWLVGIDNVRKRYSISAAAHNLGVVMRALFRMGTPRGLQQYQNALQTALLSLHLACSAAWFAVRPFWTLAATPVAASRARRLPAAPTPRLLVI